MVVTNVSVQLFASSAITLYVPPPTFERSSNVDPVFHSYVNGAAPPLTVKSIIPVVSPKHNTFVCVSLIKIGFVRLTKVTVSES